MESRNPGRHPRKEVWKAISLKGGDELCGWVAGPLIGLYGHMYPPFKPCYKELLGEDAHCPHHEFRGAPTFQGYWPLYSETGKQVIIPISEDAFDLVKQFKLFDPVKVSKRDHQFAAIKIEANPKASWYRATMQTRQRAVDIRPWIIFTMWKKETALVNHYTAHPLTTPLPAIERGGPKKDDKVEVPKFNLKREVMIETYKQNGHADLVADLPPKCDDAVEAVKRRIMEKAKRFDKNGTGG